MRCSTVTDVWLGNWKGKFGFQRWQNVWSKFMKCAFCRIQVFLPHISALLLSNFVATDVYALSIIFLKSLPADFFPFLVWAKFWVPVLVRSCEVGLGPNAQLVFGAYIAELTIILPVRSEHSKRLIVKNGPVSAHCLCDCRHIWSWIPRICCRWWHLPQFCPKTLERR